VTTSAAVHTFRRVEHVMGMPISLALRGRHADDAAGSAAFVVRADGSTTTVTGPVG
jgi:hypothetical protein